MIIVTNSRGATYAIPGGTPEAEAMMKAGYVRTAKTMWVSLAGAQIDVIADGVAIISA